MRWIIGRFLLFGLCLYVGALNALAVSSWPGWRGDGSGVLPAGPLPTVWNTATNIAWKTPLPGEGNSSPVVWGASAFVTASLDNGAQRLVLCLDTRDGKVRWQRAFPVEHPAPTYPKTGYAAATPVTDGERVYAFFDDPGLVVLDMDGNVLWTRALGPFKNSYNLASSPVLCGDLVVQCCDHEGDGFIVAFDKRSGEERWRTPRKQGAQYTTPLVMMVDGAAQIVVNGHPVVAYDAQNGNARWSCRGMMDTVAPSAVTGNGLVYVASGRNGPAQAIDPTGNGDVTDTHVVLQVATGGPYVISPLAVPQFALPADNGILRYLDAKGNITQEINLPGHYTASPVGDAQRLYWTNEDGKTYVVRYEAGKAKLLAVNTLGEKVLASPAVADGRLYLRGDKALYCIAGAGGAPTVPTTTPETRTFPELKQDYDDHQAGEGDDVARRLHIVDAVAALHDPAGISFLQQVALRDNHWDVSEAAIKALGTQGKNAVPALLPMFNEWRPYLKVAAAQALARYPETPTQPSLVKAAGDENPLVRIAVLTTLATIASNPVNYANSTLDTLLAATQDKEGIVRAAAYRGLARLQGKINSWHDAVIRRCIAGTTDTNNIAAAAARDAVTALKIPAELAVPNQRLYGDNAMPSYARSYRAGPLNFTFVDGELRYLHIGNLEIIRRIYFAVRDSNWDTTMPVLSQVQTSCSGSGDTAGFAASFAAVCKNALTDYAWTGTITGTSAGKITFTAKGKAGSPFKSPRVGFCLLFGTDALAGQPYTLTDNKGVTTKGVFPRLTPPGLLATSFHTISYTTAEGITVTCSVDNGFGMEDQRNFCDSSYKAFHNIGYPWDVPAGEERSATLTVEVAGKAAGRETWDTHLAIGKPLPGCRLPKITQVDPKEKAESFSGLNANRVTLKKAARVAWAFNPTAHLTDDDTLFENQTAIIDQVRTIRTVAPTAVLHIGPIGFDSPYPRPGRDPRNNGFFAAAWSGAMVTALARAGVDEAAFAAGPLYVTPALQLFLPYAGRQTLDTTLAGRDSGALRAVAVQSGAEEVLWIVNTTDELQQLTLDGLDAATLIVDRVAPHLVDQPAAARHAVHLATPHPTLHLAPYEVCRVRIATGGIRRK